MATVNSMGFHDDPRSREFADVAKEYADLWREHDPDRQHYEQVRTSFLRWFRTLGQLGLNPQDGAIVFCGPGFDIADKRDLDPTIVNSHVADHPQIIGADWSRDVLMNFQQSVSKVSPRAANRIDLVRRDFSGGLSARFDWMISDALESVQTQEDFSDLISMLKNEIGIDEIRKHRLPSELYDAFDHRVIAEAGMGALNFERITKGQTEVRFIIANMLLAGMFALTEKKFREKLFQYALTDEQTADALATWQQIILKLNNTVAAEFIQDGLTNNPRAYILAPTDVNVHYTDIDTFDRLSFLDIRERVNSMQMRLKRIGQWTLNDEGETPPHTHEIQVLSAYAAPKANERGDPSDSEPAPIVIVPSSDGASPLHLPDGLAALRRVLTPPGRRATA